MIFEVWRRRSLLARVRTCRGADLSPPEQAAVLDIMEALPRSRIGRRLAAAYPWIVWTFARQRIDAATRLSDGYWSSNGRNVGHDVLSACDRALATVRTVLGKHRNSSDIHHHVDAALIALIEQQRAGPGDDDGYGIGTLHEIRRDMERALRA